jgi:hypothetical protein
MTARLRRPAPEIVTFGVRRKRIAASVDSAGNWPRRSSAIGVLHDAVDAATPS